MFRNYAKIKCFNLLKQSVFWFGIFLILLMPFLGRIKSQRLHGDEINWLHSSIYFKLFFLDKDIKNEQWKNSYACTDPPIGKYIFGLVLYAAGYGDKINTLADKRCQWHFNKGYNWNMNYIATALEGIPFKGMLYYLRLAMAIIGGLTCLLILWIGKKVFNFKAGLIAALLLAYNPLMLLWSVRLMTESLLLFFLTANTALMVFFYNSFLEKKMLKTFLFSGAIGMNIALASGTKLNGFLTAFIFITFCALIICISKTHKEIKIILISALIAAVIAMCAFVFMNPYLYDNPLGGIVDMVKYRIKIIYFQEKLFGPAIRIDSLGEKLYFAVQTNLFPFISAPFIFKCGAFLIKCVAFILLLYSEAEYFLKNHKFSVKSIIIIWIGVSFIGIIIWIPFCWERYYLPLFPCEAVILGYAIDRVIGKWRDLWFRGKTILKNS